MKLILSLLALLLLSLPVSAQVTVQANVKLAWNPNLEPDLAGYRLYVSASATNNFLPVLETTNTTASITITNRAQVYVTAFNTSMMESLPSNTLQLNPTQPAAPTRLMLQTLTLVYTNRP